MTAKEALEEVHCWLTNHGGDPYVDEGLRYLLFEVIPTALLNYSPDSNGEISSDCGCSGWNCGACGKLTWSCKEGSDDLPDLCDRCWDYVTRENRAGDDPDEVTQTLRLMRLIERKALRPVVAESEGT